MKRTIHRATWIPLVLGACFIAGIAVAFGGGRVELAGITLAAIPLVVTGAAFAARRGVHR